MLGGDLVFGNHRGDLVPVKPHSRVQKFPVGDVLVGRLGGPWMSGGRELDVGDIETGDDFDDSGYVFCFF